MVKSPENTTLGICLTMGVRHQDSASDLPVTLEKSCEQPELVWNWPQMLRFWEWGTQELLWHLFTWRTQNYLIWCAHSLLKQSCIRGTKYPLVWVSWTEIPGWRAIQHEGLQSRLCLRAVLSGSQTVSTHLCSRTITHAGVDLEVPLLRVTLRLVCLGWM